MSKTVCEADFRIPELRDAKVEDYEFNDNGQLVRKDRWKNAIYDICGLVGCNTRDFELNVVFEAVEKLTLSEAEWETAINDEFSFYPDQHSMVTVKLNDGSVINNVKFTWMQRKAYWESKYGTFTTEVTAWRQAEITA